MPAAKPDEHFSVLIGQLLATVENTATMLENLRQESRDNSQKIVAAVTTLEVVQQTVAELVKVVKDGNGQESLVSQVHALQHEFGHRRLELDTHQAQLKQHDTQLDTLQSAHTQSGARLGMATALVLFLGWLVTTAIALYGAVGSR